MSSHALPGFSRALQKIKQPPWQGVRPCLVWHRTRGIASPAQHITLSVGKEPAVQQLLVQLLLPRGTAAEGRTRALQDEGQCTPAGTLALQKYRQKAPPLCPAARGRLSGAANPAQDLQHATTWLTQPLQRQAGPGLQSWAGTAGAAGGSPKAHRSHLRLCPHVAHHLREVRVSSRGRVKEAAPHVQLREGARPGGRGSVEGGTAGVAAEREAQRAAEGTRRGVRSHTTGNSLQFGATCCVPHAAIVGRASQPMATCTRAARAAWATSNPRRPAPPHPPHLPHAVPQERERIGIPVLAWRLAVQVWRQRYAPPVARHAAAAAAAIPAAAAAAARAGSAAARAGARRGIIP